MAVYATFADVQARAGRIAGALDVPGKRPRKEDIDAFLAEVGSEIDALIRARGYDPATLEQTTKDALKGVNADGALLLAFPAIFPGGIPDEARGLYGATAKRYDRTLELLRAGDLPAILVLEGGEVGGQSAGSFWEDEPDYDVAPRAEEEIEAAVGPQFKRGQVF